MNRPCFAALRDKMQSVKTAFGSLSRNALVSVALQVARKKLPCIAAFSPLKFAWEPLRVKSLGTFTSLRRCSLLRHVFSLAIRSHALIQNKLRNFKQNWTNIFWSFRIRCHLHVQSKKSKTKPLYELSILMRSEFELARICTRNVALRFFMSFDRKLSWAVIDCQALQNDWFTSCPFIPKL